MILLRRLCLRYLVTTTLKIIDFAKFANGTMCTYFSKKPFNVKLVPLPTIVPIPPRLDA